MLARERAFVGADNSGVPRQRLEPLRPGTFALQASDPTGADSGGMPVKPCVESQEAGQREQPDRAEEQHGTQQRERVPTAVADRSDQEQARHDGHVHARVGGAALPRRSDGGQPGREIVDERGQFVELVSGQRARAAVPEGLMRGLLHARRSGHLKQPPGLVQYLAIAPAPVPSQRLGQEGRRSLPGCTARHGIPRMSGRRGKSAGVLPRLRSVSVRLELSRIVVRRRRAGVRGTRPESRRCAAM